MLKRENSSTDYSHSVSLCLSLLYLHGAHTSTWSKAVYWQGTPGVERRGWIDGDGVCGGIKGHAASIAEQVQGLIGSGNGWSM